MPSHTAELLAAIIFALALIHTFAARQVELLSYRFPRHAGLFHLLGEVEVIFGFWAIVLVVVLAIVNGEAHALAYAESRHYTEPLFVFVVMVVSAARPVLVAVVGTVNFVAQRLPVATSLAKAWLGLAMVPLLIVLSVAVR